MLAVVCAGHSFAQMMKLWPASSMLKPVVSREAPQPITRISIALLQ